MALPSITTQAAKTNLPNLFKTVHNCPSTRQHTHVLLKHAHKPQNLQHTKSLLLLNSSQIPLRLPALNKPSVTPSPRHIVTSIALEPKTKAGGNAPSIDSLRCPRAIYTRCISRPTKALSIRKHPAPPPLPHCTSLKYPSRTPTTQTEKQL